MISMRWRDYSDKDHAADTAAALLPLAMLDNQL